MLIIRRCIKAILNIFYIYTYSPQNKKIWFYYGHDIYTSYAYKLLLFSGFSVRLTSVFCLLGTQYLIGKTLISLGNNVNRIAPREVDEHLIEPSGQGCLNRCAKCR